MVSAKAEADALVVTGHKAVEAARAELDKDRALLEEATKESNKAAAAVMASAKAKANALVVAGHKAVEAARAELVKDRALLEDEKKMAILVKSSEVISLKVGGTGLAVLRSTLTSVEVSMLASMLSGRWESTLVKDKHGDVFVSCCHNVPEVASRFPCCEDRVRVLRLVERAWLHRVERAKVHDHTTKEAVARGWHLKVTRNVGLLRAV